MTGVTSNRVVGARECAGVSSHVPAEILAPGATCTVLVAGTHRPAVVVRLRGDKVYVKYAEGALYRCAWVMTSKLSPA
jgi:hypothetical protein